MGSTVKADGDLLWSDSDIGWHVDEVAEDLATFGLGLVSPDNPAVQVLFFGLALLSGCGVLGGLYLLLRVFH